MRSFSEDYHSKLKTLLQRGCIVLLPKGKEDMYEIGIRDKDGRYQRLAIDKDARKAIDEAYEKTNPSNSRLSYLSKMWNSEDGRAILFIILGIVAFGLASYPLLAAFYKIASQ